MYPHVCDTKEQHFDFWVSFQSQLLEEDSMSVSAAGDEGAPNHCLSGFVLAKGSTGLKSTVAHPFWLLFPVFHGHAVYNDFN